MRKENSMDNTYVTTEEKTQEKIKVDSIYTIVTVRGDRPYYENMYREVGDNYYHIGYSSYCLDVALEYREKYFELVERESDWIPCNERMPENDVEVLVWFEYFRYGAYNRPYQTIGISYVHRGIWSGIVNGESGWRNLRIIAWMPLPGPYKGE